ncbi:hypothetical protein OT109_14565 [Phycisphaeraceae bacterium D3-23]
MRLYPHALMVAAVLAAGVAPLAIAPPAYAQETQLTGQQRADLRRLRNVVIEVENRAGRLQAHIAEWRGLGTQVGDNRVNNFNADAQALADAFTLGSEIAPNLPGDHEEVADLVDRLNAGAVVYQESIATATALLSGANEAMEAAGGREAITADVQRVDDISAEYTNFGGIMQGSPERAYELIQQFPPIVEEIQRIEAQYADFLAQDNADTAPLRNQIAQARNRLRRAQQDAHEAVAGARNTAGSHLDNARDALALAIENRDPAPFNTNGSITYDLDTAKHYLQLARAIHAADAQPLVDRYLARSTPKRKKPANPSKPRSSPPTAPPPTPTPATTPTHSRPPPRPPGSKNTPTTPSSASLSPPPTGPAKPSGPGGATTGTSPTPAPSRPASSSKPKAPPAPPRSTTTPSTSPKTTKTKTPCPTVPGQNKPPKIYTFTTDSSPKTSASKLRLRAATDSGRGGR